MEAVFVAILFSNAIFSLAWLIVGLQKRERQYKGSTYLVFFTGASVIWSLGSGFLVFQTEVLPAHIARCVDLFGTVVYMIAVILILSTISNVSITLKRVFYGFTHLGFFIFGYSLLPDAFVFERQNWGMSFSFKSAVYGNIYTAFFLSCALIMVYLIYNMLTEGNKSARFFAKAFIVVWLIIVIGSVSDMVLPIFGAPSAPGSSIAQFWGLVIVWYAMDHVSHSIISVKNMSEQVYYSISSPVFMTDKDGKIIVYNDAAASFFKVDRDSSETHNINEYFTIPANAKYYDGGKTVSFEAHCKANGILCSVQGNKVIDRFDELIGYIGVLTDLTEQLETRKKLEEAREEADSANKAKSLFLANMSHEIRTPVNAIMGFSELALAENPSKEMKEYLDDIKSASNTLLSSINDILNISKIEAGKLEIVNEDYSFLSLLRSVKSIISVQASAKDLSFSVVIDGQVPMGLYGDDVRIQEILINLLNNSVKYTDNGHVILKVSAKKRGKEFVELVLSVSDSGRGIKEEDLKKLFDAFERADKQKNHRTEGTGLGLSIVKGYLNLMGGSINVKSEYGKGSEFTVCIGQKIKDPTPLTQDDLTKTDNAVKRLGRIKVKDTKVLLVDDNKVNLKVISKIFMTYGLSTDMAISGKEALEMCKNHNYPIVFMDHMMPEMDGVETMHELRKSSAFYEKDCVIVVLTANALDGIKEGLMKEGFNDYLSKPLNLDEFERTIKTYLPKELIEESE